MSTHYLKRFFKPRSIAVFGASEKQHSMGGVVLKNLIESGFEGHLVAVNTQVYEAVFEVPCYQKVSELPELPELAIICSPTDAVADIIHELGAHQVKAALILTGGLSRSQNESLQSLKEAVTQAAKPYGIRILGPDCMGLLVPGNNMNASYSHLNIQKGKVAYVGQSGILGTAMIDWANGQGIGFSNFLTLGGSVDVNLPSVIDYLASDPYTHAILLQIDQIYDAHHFISAIRAAARNKLVLVLKSNTFYRDEDKRQQLPPGINDLEKISDAVLRRAGVVRVDSSDELFDALETLTTMKPLRGERLAILCNGMGPNALAANRLLKCRGHLATLSDQTLNRLTALLPAFSLRENPIDLNADATPERFARVTELLIRDDAVDAVLVIHAPTHLAPGIETAEAVIKVASKVKRNVLTSWMGRSTAIAARNLFNDAKIPTFITPEKAIDAFMHMVEYRRNQDVMRQTPAVSSQQVTPQRQQRAQQLIDQAQQQDRDHLTHHEAVALLACYDLPVAHCHYTQGIDEVVAIAKRLDCAIAVKALHQGNRYPFSYDTRTGQRWQDLALDLHGPEEIQHSITQLTYRIHERYGEEAHDGFSVQRMKRGFQSLQISVGITRDPVFGPMVFFGAGGYAVDIQDDRQLMLPPLNTNLAKELMKNSRIYRFIQENSYRHQEDIEQLCNLLITLSDMVVDLPELKAVEINPLLINKSGLLALDVTASLGESCSPAISPYPLLLCEESKLVRSQRRVTLRPIRGEDEPNHLEFWNTLSPESIRLRYFYSRSVPSHYELANWTQIDYDREMAFLATASRLVGNGEETLGVIRTHTDPDNISAEFAVVIRDNLQGEGLGRMLMQKMIDYCRQRGTLEISGTTMPSNKGMQKLAKKLGFANRFNVEEDVVEMRMLLNEPTEDWQKQRLQH